MKYGLILLAGWAARASWAVVFLLENPTNGWQPSERETPWVGGFLLAATVAGVQPYVSAGNL